MNVIDRIIENKKVTLTQTKKQKPLEKLKEEAIDIVSTKTKLFRFQEKLKNKTTQLIAEYKPASPSKGNISTLKAEDVIPIYDKNNVDMMSILTEETYFKSNLKNFNIANNLTNKPLLRKDFIIDEYMIYEAAVNNASGILLISGICPNIEEYLNISRNLGLDAVVECHTLEDIESVVDYNPEIIGINNRNLDDFTINLKTTKELKKYVPNYLISESGVKTIEDAKKLKEYGADGILIGTSILQNNTEKEIEKFIENLINVLQK